MKNIIRASYNAGKTPAPSQAQNRRKIYIAVASDSHHYDLCFLQSMIVLCLSELDFSLTFGWSFDTSIDRATNVLTANFLETDCTHLLLIGSDIGFQAADVDMITSNDAEVVGGICPLRTLEEKVTWIGSPLKEPRCPRPDGLQQVKSIGSGFLCIRRTAIEKMIKVFGKKIGYKQSWKPFRKEYAIWRESVKASRFLTSDENFCLLWSRLGGKIFCDTRVILRHAGRAVWPLPVQQGNPFIKKAA